MIMAKILLLYVPTDKTPFKEIISEQVLTFINDILIDFGHEVLKHEYNPGTIEFLMENLDSDIIFNMAYGYTSATENIFETQANIVERLEFFNSNILGSSAQVQKIVQDKLCCAQILSKKGFKVPYNFEIKDVYSLNNQLLLIKPRIGACHRGIKIIESDNIHEGVITIRPIN